MCWNKDVSLNTFIFSILSLLFVYYNNKYTKYKIKEFTSIWVYLLFVSFISIQLVEYFLWKNLNNIKMNINFTVIAFILILLQPFFCIMSILNIKERNKLLQYYLLFVTVLIFIYIYKNVKLKTSILQNGHLNWEWLTNIDRPLIIFWNIWFIFTIYPMIMSKNYKMLSIFVLFLLITYYTYFKHNSFSTMWCWMSNFIMIVFLIQILFILPYKEKGELC